MYIMHMRVLAIRVARGTHSDHSGDAAGIVPAVADVRAYCNVSGDPMRRRHISG